MSGLSSSVSNLQSSLDFNIFYIFDIFCCFGWFVYFPTVNLLSELALFTAYITCFQGGKDNISAVIVVLGVRRGVDLQKIKRACKGHSVKVMTLGGVF